MTEHKASAIPPPLDRLSPGEREVLVMLARGHTAKTIGTSLGISVAAVNERLRSARRKTGAGSSRELARSLAQENRDDFLGVGEATGATASSGGKAPARRWNSRRNVMVAAGALIAALALSQIIKPDVVQTPALPTVAGVPGPEADIVSRMAAGPDARQLRMRLQDETRDETWAAATEAGIRAAYGQIPGVARSVNTLAVTCAATLCEVVGRTRPAASTDDITAVLADMQSGDLNVAIERLRLETKMTGFTTDPNNPAAIGFVAYFER